MKMSIDERLTRIEDLLTLREEMDLGDWAMEYAEDLANLVSGLSHHLSRGGALPRKWRAAVPPRD